MAERRAGRPPGRIGRSSDSGERRSERPRSADLPVRKPAGKPRASGGRASPPPKSLAPRSAPKPAPRVEEAPKPAAAKPRVPLPTAVQTLGVTADEAGMRVDRFLTARFPDLAFTHVQRVVRTGQLRVDGKRAKPNDRLEEGQQVRVPPLRLDEKAAPRAPAALSKDAEAIRAMVLFEDDDVMVLDKPAGLAVQGGSGTTRHLDGMLEALRDRAGQKPRLVHRLDKDTAGCLVVAKTRFAATALAKAFRSRTTRKVYWAIVAGVPRTKQGRISTYLAREDVGEADSRMAVSRHGDEGASHALTYYATVETAGQKLAWLSMKPVTGRTHQLRAHAAHIGHPIVGDPKYFSIENWELPGGIQNRLHLLARRIVVPHPRTGKPLDVTAPLPAHMRQTFSLLGLDLTRYDPIEEAPEA